MSNIDLGLGSIEAEDAKADLLKPLDGGRKPRKAKVSVVPMNLRLPADSVEALRLARVHDGITAVARVRAMIQLWRDDEAIRDQIDAIAKDL